MKKYSDSFNRDFNWYLKMRHLFNFDGNIETRVIYNRNGIPWKEAFYKYDSTGVMFATKHPNLLAALLKTKGSVNLHIKMYAEDRANGLFPGIEFRAFCIKHKCPSWFREAVERQKFKYYNKTNL